MAPNEKSSLISVQFSSDLFLNAALQPGSSENVIGTMKIYSRRGYFELRSVNHSVRS